MKWSPTFHSISLTHKPYFTPHSNSQATKQRSSHPFSLPQTTKHFRDNEISSPLKQTTQIVRPLNIKADIHFTQVVEKREYSKEE